MSFLLLLTCCLTDLADEDSGKSKKLDSWDWLRSIYNISAPYCTWYC